jgi:hypothetical protein
MDGGPARIYILPIPIMSSLERMRIRGARTVTEGKTRLLSAIISGGMILDSSRLADDPQGQELVRAVYDNRHLFAVASEGRAFRPVGGNTVERAASVFHPKSRGWLSSTPMRNNHKRSPCHLSASISI